MRAAALSWERGERRWGGDRERTEGSSAETEVKRNTLERNRKKNETGRGSAGKGEIRER